MANKARYHPRKVKTEEIIKFRGVFEPDPAHNMSKAYVGSSNNLPSTKLRQMDSRHGHVEREAYDDGINTGASLTSFAVIGEGSNLWANVYQPFPRKYLKDYPTPQIIYPPLASGGSSGGGDDYVFQDPPIAITPPLPPIPPVDDFVWPVDEFGNLLQLDDVVYSPDDLAWQGHASVYNVDATEQFVTMTFYNYLDIQTELEAEQRIQVIQYSLLTQVGSVSSISFGEDNYITVTYGIKLQGGIEAAPHIKKGFVLFNLAIDYVFLDVSVLLEAIPPNFEYCQEMLNERKSLRFIPEEDPLTPSDYATYQQQYFIVKDWQQFIFDNLWAFKSKWRDWWAGIDDFLAITSMDANLPYMQMSASTYETDYAEDNPEINLSTSNWNNSYVHGAFKDEAFYYYGKKIGYPLSNGVESGFRRYINDSFVGYGFIEIGDDINAKTLYDMMTYLNGMYGIAQRTAAPVRGVISDYRDAQLEDINVQPWASDNLHLIEQAPIIRSGLVVGDADGQLSELTESVILYPYNGSAGKEYFMDARVKRKRSHFHLRWQSGWLPADRNISCRCRSWCISTFNTDTFDQFGISHQYRPRFLLAEKTLVVPEWDERHFTPHGINGSEMSHAEFVIQDRWAFGDPQDSWAESTVHIGVANMMEYDLKMMK